MKTVPQAASRFGPTAATANVTPSASHAMNGTPRIRPRVRRQLPAPSMEFLTTGAQAVGVPALQGPRILSPGLVPKSPVEPGAVGDVRLLVERVTKGFTTNEYATAQELGWNAYLERQLHPERLDDSLVDATLRPLGSLELNTEQLLELYPDGDAAQVAYELLGMTMLRSIISTRQLYERMVEFWSDHFNIYHLDDLAIWWKTVDDREVIRKHALGKFPDMLKASARSAAMLWYLDNYANISTAPQENYARELMELHTLGVDGPYTEQDVREVARCFTGWTFHGVFSVGTVGEFVFLQGLHDVGQKEVLGETISALGGIEDGERVLDILAMHPKTADFISRKMCAWLLHADAPEDVVQRVVNTYLHTGGDIKSMIRVILQPLNVMRAAAAKREKFRRPRHLVSALMRSTSASSGNLLELLNPLFRMGHVPYWWPAPNGYPDSAQAWGTSLLPRWTFVQRFFDFQLGSTGPAPATLSDFLQGYPRSRYAEAIDIVLTGGRLDRRDVDDVQAHIDAAPTFNGAVMREAYALAASCPSYQYY